MRKVFPHLMTGNMFFTKYGGLIMKECRSDLWVNPYIFFFYVMHIKYMQSTDVNKYRVYATYLFGACIKLNIQKLFCIHANHKISTFIRKNNNFPFTFSVTDIFM